MHCVYSAAYCLSVLLHQTGQATGSEALELLGRFGVKLRISSALWDCDAGVVVGGEGREMEVEIGMRETVPNSKRRSLEGESAKEESVEEGGELGVLRHLDKVRIFRNAVPPELHAALCKAFNPSSVFWRETNYLDRGYFSFWWVTFSF